jgi:uncharacterized protein
MGYFRMSTDRKAAVVTSAGQGSGEGIVKASRERNHRISLPETESPWHEGERTIQRHMGVAEKMELVGRHSIRGFLVDQHRQFYPQLSFVVLGSVAPGGAVWATLRAGPPGFLQSPDLARLGVALPRDDNDPADAGMNDGDGIALLGIELHTRRRNRVNGIIRRSSPQGFSIEVSQSFGNCPRFIQPRLLEPVRDFAVPPTRGLIHLPRIEGRASEMVKTADTFFVASSVLGNNGIAQPDVSHRGGTAGFIRLDADGGLTIPDYSGNRFFNTLGNLLLNPKAGLVFADFETGDLLQMTGDAGVILGNPEPEEFPGAEHLWRFRPKQILLRPDALPIRMKSGSSIRL